MLEEVFKELTEVDGALFFLYDLLVFFVHVKWKSECWTLKNDLFR